MAYSQWETFTTSNSYSPPVNFCSKRPSPVFVLVSSVQLHSRVRLFATPWISACQASLSITNSQGSLKLTFIKSVMPSSHLILCRPLLLLPPIPPSIRVFSSESALHMRWPKYWSFSFSWLQIYKELTGGKYTKAVSLWIWSTEFWEVKFSEWWILTEFDEGLSKK